VRGSIAYVDDLRLPGLLHAAVLRSPHAHARIVAIDTTAAKALPACTPC
jgi:carbon-monoxide dehydrogenase large subunit